MIKDQIILTSPGQTSNRIYPQEALTAVCDKANQEMLPVGFFDAASYQNMPLDKIMGRVVNARIEDNAVIGDIEVYEGSPGYLLYKKLIESGCRASFACAGSGKLTKSAQDEYTVTEYMPFMVQVHNDDKPDS